MTRLEVVWARHGQAEHNVLIDAGRKAEGRALLDPPLTALGLEQARGLAGSLAQVVQGGELEEAPAVALSSLVDAVVTSPMTRALETVEAAFGPEPPVPVLVTSLHTETGIPQEGDEVAGTPCQKGSPLPELEVRGGQGRRGQASVSHPGRGSFMKCAIPWALNDVVQARFPGFDFSAVHADGQWQCADETSGYFHPLAAPERLRLFRDWLEALPFGRILVVGHSGFFKRFLGGSKMKNCQAMAMPLEETLVE